MGTQQIDVQRLTIPLEANFLTSTRRGQWAYCTDTKRILGHNKTADTTDFGISDDSLVAVLATSNTFSADQSMGGNKITEVSDLTSASTMTFGIDSDNDSSSDYFSWVHNGSTELLRLSETGLGLGITPTTKLHVNDSDNAHLKFQSASNVSTLNLERIASAIDDDVVSEVYFRGPTANDTVIDYAAIKVTATDTDNTFPKGKIELIHTYENNPYTAFEANATETNVKSIGSLDFYIDDNDNGVGSSFEWFHNGSTKLMRLQDNGELVIGSITNYRSLTVAGMGAGGSGGTGIGVVEGQPLAWFDYLTDDNSGRIYADSSDKMYFQNTSSNTTRMMIDAGGEIGFGTTSPDCLIHAHLASAGAITAPTNTVLAIENSTNAYLSFLVPSSDTSGIDWQNTTASLTFNDSTNTLELNNNSNVLQILDASASLSISGPITISTGLLENTTTFTGKIVTDDSDASHGSIRIPSGSDTTATVTGAVELWFDGTNIKARTGTTTRTLDWT